MCCKTKNQDLDYFDSLPDALLLFIFNKLQDAKSLTKCLLVSKRFSSLIPFTNSIFISIPPLQPLSKPNTLRLGVRNLFLKPLRCFQQTMAPKSATRCFDSSYYCQPNGALKNFKEMKSLHIELPSSHGDDELGSSSSGASFLKWKAEFGSNLKTCIIVGATSFERSNNKSSVCLQQKELQEETILTDDELKLRVIWTISCLIAASTRHYLVKKILADHPIPMLQKLVISDANKQGKFNMVKEDIVEMRNCRSSSSEQETSSLMERTPVPEMNMKLWYVPMVELPESGYVMRGATLVLIRPVADDHGMIHEKRNIGDSMEYLEDDGKAFSEAVREVIKVNKSYLMTMSSF
ncbi:hypothetical protein PTKIN_Ptkin03bG0099000 [Pterospermum kingtungense]